MKEVKGKEVTGLETQKEILLAGQTDMLFSAVVMSL